ncbi:hypothetical protein BJ322DRAFT_1218661 [Thelephora terrestris]|uniref:Nephrocystin 3-like N-terminal domain-containing protein n=1 Tax=Thelephora terrestris TaxID=56493 RepID=A0A9P6HG90_9AGAM|nr:hypothetical protein BJ322DRAFT_1218661 [Thelephora terrestris]
MKHLRKIMRKKSPKPPHQTISSGEPPSIAAGPSGFVSALAAPEDESGGTGSFQHPVDEDPELITSECLIFDGLIENPGHIHDVNTGGETGERKIESAEASRSAKRARKGTLHGDAIMATEKFGPLKVVLGSIPALFANRERIVAAGNKVENLLSHVAKLEEHLNSRPSDVAEQRRRDELIRKFKGIEGRLRSMPEWQQPTDHARDDEDVFGLLDDLQEAVINYQMERRGAVEIQPVYWLNGLAGTGKTTIAQTIAERTFADGRLGASFFCSRDFEDRRNLKSIFPTIGVQLACTHVEFRSIFVPLVQSDPDVAHETLYSQMNKLIVQPLVKSAISTMIMIDALDECKDDEPASAILSVLGQFVDKIPKVKFFVTGCLEPRIRNGFRLPLLVEATNIIFLHDVEPGEAMATVRFIDTKNKNPQKQLDRLIQSRDSGSEGRVKFRTNTTLDSLYVSILHDAFGDDEPEDDAKVRLVLAVVTLAANPLSPSSIATLLGFDLGDIFLILSSLHSLLILSEDVHHPIRPFHKSFPDFIVDSAQCTNQRFWLQPPIHHTKILLACLELMNEKLKQNMCQLPDGVTNVEVKDLKERTREHIDKALEYACKSWHKHLDSGSMEKVKITPVLHRSLEEKFLFWLEVLSVLGATRGAVDALERAEKWVDVSWTVELNKDCLCFLVEFFDVISTSAPHIYTSALLLAPQTLAVHKLYKQYSCPLAKVLWGLQNSWNVVLAKDCEAYANVVTCFSPNGCTLSLVDKEKLTSWDLQTGSPLSTIFFTQRWDDHINPFSVVYSMDGNMLAISGSSHDSQTVIVTWLITMWEATFTSMNTPTMTGFLSTPDEVFDTNWGRILFFPALSQKYSLHLGHTGSQIPSEI